MGLNSFISFKNEQKRLPKLLTALPRLAACLGNFYIAYRECDNFPYDRIDDIFGRFVLICGALVNLTAVIENLRNAKIVKQIMCEISTVINILETCLNIKYSLKMVKRSLNRKLITHGTVIVLSSIIKYYIETIHGKRLTFSILWAICNVIKYIHLLHLEFYIEFIRHALKSLSAKLTNKMTDQPNYWYHGQKDELWHDLHYMRSVYLRLWNISQKANALFG